MYPCYLWWQHTVRHNILAGIGNCWTTFWHTSKYDRKEQQWRKWSHHTNNLDYLWSAPSSLVSWSSIVKSCWCIWTKKVCSSDGNYSAMFISYSIPLFIILPRHLLFQKHFLWILVWAVSITNRQLQCIVHNSTINLCNGTKSRDIICRCTRWKCDMHFDLFYTVMKIHVIVSFLITFLLLNGFARKRWISEIYKWRKSLFLFSSNEVGKLDIHFLNSDTKQEMQL